MRIHNESCQHQCLGSKHWFTDNPDIFGRSPQLVVGVVGILNGSLKSL